MSQPKITSALAPTGYERWIWIELLGFDITQRDYGVSAWCERAGFTPQVATLLLSDPEFVHGHTGRLDRAFSQGVCSYDGHPFNEERSRQPWTARHLAGLIKALHRKGTEVYFTHFDAPLEGWLARHPELRFLNRHGEWISFMSPYKRLKSGQPYADFFRPLLEKVVTDFGFDGYHAGDGFAHPRIPIYDGDFSDDTIERYEKWAGDDLPKALSLSANENRLLVRKRADWLWQKNRLSWIQFHREVTTGFWRDIADTLGAKQRKLIFNTCWTRDPFEALYRYGVDYPALHTAGVSAFLAETASAVHEYGADLPYGEDGAEAWEPRGTLCRFTTNLQLLRASMPNAKIIFMNGLKDTNEAWNGIHHAPTNLESEILSHTGTFAVTSGKKLRPSSDGVISVLSDGLSQTDWKWIRQRWDLGYSVKPTSLPGAAVYWGNEFHERLVRDYVECRHAPFAEVLAQLSLSGAPLSVSVRADDLPSWNGTVVVIHPHLLTPEEWQQLASRTAWPLITVGGPAPATKSASFHQSYGDGPDAFHLSVFHWEGVQPKSSRLPKPGPSAQMKAEDPFRWLVALPAREIPEGIYQYAAEWILHAVSGVRVLINQSDIHAWAYSIKANTLRVYVRNESFYYRSCLIEMPRACKMVKTLTSFPGNPVTPSGAKLKFKVAGKSMAVFDVTLSK